MAYELHMWPYWRDQFCAPVDALEAYYEELLKEDTQESQDLRVAASNIRNARRARDSFRNEEPHNPKLEWETQHIITINNAAIDSIMKELDEKHPFVED